MSFVYAIRAVEAPIVKIGKAQNPLNRLRSIQTGSAYKLGIYATRPGGLNEEAKLHFDLREWRLNGEWFEWRDEVRRVIGPPEWVVEDGFTGCEEARAFRPSEIEKRLVELTAERKLLERAVGELEKKRGVLEVQVSGLRRNWAESAEKQLSPLGKFIATARVGIDRVNRDVRNAHYGGCRASVAMHSYMLFGRLLESAYWQMKEDWRRVMRDVSDAEVVRMPGLECGWRDVYSNNFENEADWIENAGRSFVRGFLTQIVGTDEARNVAREI